jgi:hypothetical protein
MVLFMHCFECIEKILHYLLWLREKDCIFEFFVIKEVICGFESLGEAFSEYGTLLLFDSFVD